MAEFLVRVPELEAPDTSLFTSLGYLVGKHAGMEVPVIDGIVGTPSTEALKAFSSTVATAGTVGLFHSVGVTPEAPRLAVSLGDRTPQRVLDVRRDDLREVWAQLSTGMGESLQLVVMGSPHATLGDFLELADLVDGQTKQPTSMSSLPRAGSSRTRRGHRGCLA